MHCNCQPSLDCLNLQLEALQVLQNLSSSAAGQQVAAASFLSLLLHCRICTRTLVPQKTPARSSSSRRSANSRIQQRLLQQQLRLWTASSAKVPSRHHRFLCCTRFLYADNSTKQLLRKAQLTWRFHNPGLKKFLKKNAEGDTLAVLDSKLGSIIKEKLDIPCIYRCAEAKATN